jgi:hypothetical protein
MFIVPLPEDKIRILSQPDLLKVKAYTSLKSEPAVYLTDVLPGGSRAVYLSDIIELNGVKVEYDSSSKLLEPLGLVKRKYNLPQIGDTITTSLIDTDHNPSRSLDVICGKTTVSLNDILNIDRAHGFESFDQKNFTKLYLDYLPYTTK